MTPPRWPCNGQTVPREDDHASCRGGVITLTWRETRRYNYPLDLARGLPSAPRGSTARWSALPVRQNRGRSFVLVSGLNSQEQKQCTRWDGWQQRWAW